MSEMVERVARAIARYHHGLGDTPKENDLAVDYHWPKYVMDARAAIRAMGVPTDAMAAAGDSSMPQFDPPSDEPGLAGIDVVKDVWASMIHEALK